jgi:hypothetical protein
MNTNQTNVRIHGRGKVQPLTRSMEAAGSDLEALLDIGPHPLAHAGSGLDTAMTKTFFESC